MANIKCNYSFPSESSNIIYANPSVPKTAPLSLKDSTIHFYYMSTTSRFYNASFINEYGKLEVLRTERYGNNFSVVSLEVNNSPEKLHKDKELLLVLREMVKLIMGTLRECDLLGMVNHNRFTILLPETDIFGSIITIRRIKRVLQSSELTKKLKISLGSASYPMDGKDFDVLIKKSRQNIKEYKESILVSLDLENRDFWSIINTLISSNSQNDIDAVDSELEKDSGKSQKLSSVSSYFFDTLQEMILREILHSPRVSGILYMPVLRQNLNPLFLQEIQKTNNLQTKIFFISDKDETKKIPNIGYIELKDKQITSTPFIFFLRRDFAYGMICKKYMDEEYKGFHTVDEVLIETLINKFQEKYLLQEQL